MRVLPKGWRGRLAVGGLLVIAAAVAMAFGHDRTPDLPSATVARGDFIEIVETRGEVRPFKSVLVTAPYQAGELQILEIKPSGASVKKGEVVAKFDALTLRRTLQDRQSERRQAVAERDQAHEQSKLKAEEDATALMKARYDVQRAKLSLGDPEVSAAMELERNRLALLDADQRLVEAEKKDQADKSSARADVDTRDRKIAKIDADIAMAERALNSLEVAAPADGTVSIMPNYRASSPMGPAQEFRAGDRAWPGAQILELPDLSSVHLQSRIDESDRGQLKVGQKATVRIDAIPDREYTATVADISLLARVDFTSGWPPAKNFDLKLSIDDPDARLRPGMSAVARVAVGRVPDMLLLPASAVFNVEGRTVVYRRMRRGFEAVAVDVRRRGRDQIAIASGLSAGDKVALVTPPGMTKAAKQ